MNVKTVAGEQRAGRGLSAALWFGQILLAAIFGMSGFMKTMTPIP